MNETTMNFTAKTQFVNALLDCPAIQDRPTRDVIVNELKNVQGISRSNIDRADIANIVNSVLNFQGGLAQLCEVLRFYEGDSVHMQQVDALYAQHGEPTKAEPISDQGKPDRADATSPNYRLIWALTSLLLLIGIVGIGWLVWDRFADNLATQPTPLPNATSLPFAPATEDETLILVTNFYLAAGIDDAEPHRKIVKAIREEIKKRKLADVRVEIEEATQLREDEREAAHELASHYNASIIIWGDETSTDITVNFLNLRQPDYAIGYVTIEANDESVHKAALADPEPYTQFVTQGLPSQLTFLALFALAQSEYDQEEHSNAITICELAIQYSEESHIKGLEKAHFYLGLLYQTLTKDTEQSIYHYDEAVELMPTFAAAYHNRGLAYGEQGQYEQASVDLDQAILLVPDNVVFDNNRRFIEKFTNDSTILLRNSTVIPTETPTSTPTSTLTPTATGTMTPNISVPTPPDKPLEKEPL